MKQIIKMVKNGQEITFICSVCGNLVYDMFVPVGKEYEPDWNKVQEICVCGTRLIHRDPIIDDSDLKTNHIINRNNGNQRKNRSATEKADLYAECIKDLGDAISIDYFDMRLYNLKRNNFKVPNNVDYLMGECIKRNIHYVELGIEHVNDMHMKKEMHERLNSLKQRYSSISKKLEIKKDFNENESIENADIDTNREMGKNIDTNREMGKNIGKNIGRNIDRNIVKDIADI